MARCKRCNQEIEFVEYIWRPPEADFYIYRGRCPACGSFWEIEEFSILGIPYIIIPSSKSKLGRFFSSLKWQLRFCLSEMGGFFLFIVFFFLAIMAFILHILEGFLGLLLRILGFQRSNKT